jgi:hypothetical protein
MVAGRRGVGPAFKIQEVARTFFREIRDKNPLTASLFYNYEISERFHKHTQVLVIIACPYLGSVVLSLGPLGIAVNVTCS